MIPYYLTGFLLKIPKLLWPKIQYWMVLSKSITIYFGGTPYLQSASILHDGIK